MFPNYCDNPKHLVTFPNAPWGIVSLPNFENHWVPNTHSHLINIAHTHTVHQMLAWLVPSSQSWEWVSLYQTIFLSYSGGRFKDASTLAAPTVARFFRGFSTEICCRVPCVSHLHDSAPRGFLSSQRATIQSVPTIQKFRYPSSLKSPQINPAGSSPPPRNPLLFYARGRQTSHKRPESEYFRFCGPYGFSCKSSNSVFAARKWSQTIGKGTRRLCSDETLFMDTKI